MWQDCRFKSDKFATSVLHFCVAKVGTKDEDRLQGDKTVPPFCVMTALDWRPFLLQVEQPASTSASPMELDQPSPPKGKGSPGK